MVTLFYNYYEPQDPVRRRQLQRCFERNYVNRKLDRIIVFSEKKPDQWDQRCVFVPLSGQPLFADFIATVAALSAENDISIILNSDCFLNDATVVRCRTIAERTVYCITRVELFCIKPLVVNWFATRKLWRKHAADSQDCWILRGRPKIEKLSLSFPMGKPGCDNRLAWEFQNAGYSIVNPFRLFHIYHYHPGKKRHYCEIDRIQGPYAFPQTVP
ncbi:MAG: hypothetical protein JW795_16115 [Chitinivibrionales bacterium]|nr:hypothetical protein [Chitinivibrionales bacterium]